MIAKIVDFYISKYISTITKKEMTNYKLVLLEVQESGRKRYVEVGISENAVDRLNLPEALNKYTNYKQCSLIGHTTFSYDGLKWIGYFIVDDIKPLEIDTHTPIVKPKK